MSGFRVDRRSKVNKILSIIAVAAVCLSGLAIAQPKDKKMTGHKMAGHKMTGHKMAGHKMGKMGKMKMAKGKMGAMKAKKMGAAKMMKKG